MKFSKLLTLLAASVFLAVHFSVSSQAQCIPGEVEWQNANTNFTRCGTPGLKSSDTYYFREEVENWTWKTHSNSAPALFHDYYDTHYTGGLTGGSIATGAICPSPNCSSTTTNDWDVNIPFTTSWTLKGGCVGSVSGPCSASKTSPGVLVCGDVQCLTMFGFLLVEWSSYSGYGCSSNLASDLIDTDSEYKHKSSSWCTVGWYTNLSDKRLSQPYTLQEFGKDTVSAVQGHWVDGLSYFNNTAYLLTACNKAMMEALLLRQRIKFKSKAGVKYTVNWDLRLNYSKPTTRTVFMNDQSWSGVGTGGTNYTDWIEFPEPQIEEQYTVDVLNIRIKGDDGSGCGGGSCNNPESENAGDGEDQLKSAAFQISLGAGKVDDSAGSLSMDQETPSADLATPSVLQFNVNPSVVVLTTNVNGSIDVAAPTMLARIVVSNSYAYWVHCSVTNAGGGYQTNSPFISHLFLNPNGSTNFNTLQHIRFRGGVAVTNEFTCETNTTTNVTWRLVSGNGLKGERLTKIYNTNQTRLETYSIFNPATAQELYRRDNLYWVLQYGERLLSEKIDPAGLGLLTTNSYDTAGRLLTSLLPDGSWTRNEYDANGLLLRTVRPFTNQPPTASTNNCRVSEFGYASVDLTLDGLTDHPGEVRTVTEFVLGQAVSKTMYAYASSGRTFTQTSTDSAAAWNASLNETNLVTRDTQNRITQIDNADATRTTIIYTDSASGRITETKTGAWSAGSFQSGVKTLTGLDNYGRLVGVTNYDITSSAILSREIYSDPDEFGRPTKTTYLNGTYAVDVKQDCCQAAYNIDRDGVASTNSYDALKRLVSTVRLRITNATVLDAASRPLFFKRTGTNGSTMVQRSLVYDAAGRVLRETNALGGTTSHSYSVDGSSQPVNVTTYPDGGARTEVYFRDGQLALVTNSAAFPVRYEYGVETNQVFSKEIKLTTNLINSSEWTKTYVDGFGRSFKTVFPGGTAPYRQSFYNNQGQLWKERDPDGIITLYTNNALGERVISATDSNRSDTIDFSGLDRITATTNDVASAHSTNVRRTRAYVVGTNNTPTSTLLSMTEVSTDGLSTWQTTYNGANSVVSSSATTIPTSGNSWTRTVTQTLPDNSTVVSVYQSGRLQSATRKDSTGAQIGATTYSYDAHGRQYAANDARNGWTTFTFNNADQVVTVTAPPVGYGVPSQVTTTFYDTMLRATGTLLPDGTSVTNEFYLNGLRKKTSGSRTYPVEYTYDYAGRMQTMKTWQNFAANSGTALTTWNYDSSRGWLSNKRYADNYGPDYTYTDAGRLATRVWARSVGGNRLTTTYSYNNAGEMSGTSYNDSGATPGVTYSYSRRGRAIQSVRNSITTDLTFSESGQLLREAYTGGALGGLSVTNIYDNWLRRTNVSVKNSTTVLAGTGYFYDNASRLATVTDGTNSAAYTYVANSPLVGQIAFQSNTVPRMTITKAYDKLNRLTSIANVPSGDSTVSFAYDYNSANQRTGATLADGSYWRYEYDSLGQVTSGRKFWSDGTPVAGQQFDYTFDDIGNRKQTKAGGDQGGNGKRVSDYGANSLNQYTNRTVPGGFDVLGVARGTVTINGNSTYRKGEYFRNEATVNNSSAAQYPSVSAVSTDGTSLTETGAVFVAKTPEVFGYDLDGNMTNDGRWSLTWDAENRLTKMQSLSGAPNGSSNRLSFAYDPQGRRISKATEIYVGSAWSITLSNRFLYDGWNLLAELNATNNALINAFRWGTDLSGSLQDAGGVGGLLFVTATNAGAHYVGYDGNGNVAVLTSASAGAASANYEYDPFGNVLRNTGPMALLNPFRFSTKYTDGESGWLNYGFRLLRDGRWLSRDPINERGDRNLYGFVGNCSVDRIDLFGLQDFRGGWALPPSCSAMAHARMNPNPGLMMPNPSKPSIGNQLFGYPPGTDLTAWFDANQGATVGHWRDAGIQQLTTLIKANCRRGMEPTGLAGSEILDENVVPAGQGGPFAPSQYGTEIPPDRMGFWDAIRTLGRYNLRFTNIRVSKLYCTCQPCYYWQGDLEATDTPGVTSGEDGRGGQILTGMGTLTDSPRIIIARWSYSGTVCCDPK